MLPSCEQPSVVCRWSPVLYELRNKPADADADADSATTTARNKPRGFDRAPYRMLLAIGTLSSVMIYDTEQLYPIVYLSKLHYSSLTDLAWYVALLHENASPWLQSFDGQSTRTRT